MSRHELDGGCGAGDAAAYALGALDPAEASRFVVHLNGCAVCRDELAAFRHVTWALLLAVPQIRAPRGLRRRVLQSLPAEPRRVARRAPRAAWLAGGLRPALALGGAAMLALAVASGIELGPGAPASREYRAQVLGSSGSARLRVAGSHAELVVHHLPQPSPGHIYEVWLQRRNQPPQRTAALFDVTSAGDGDVAVPGGVEGVRRVMVTQEPDGGSSVPTTPVLLQAWL